MTELLLADLEFSLPKAGDMPMGPREIAGYLEGLSGWSFQAETNSILKCYAFEDFATALAFTNQVGALAEDHGHHPDIALGWGSASVSLTTHDIGGIHMADLILAARIDRIQRS